MKTKNAALKPLVLVASALLCCALNLPAQPAPTITTQPTNQTVLPGTNVTLTVGVAGTGPFSYQWQINGIDVVKNNFAITTVAGNGSATYAGDGGPATNASLAVPTRVACDAAGNLYIADRGNNRIRKVDTNGIITTVAGTNSAGYSGDGGAATNASLNFPYGVALDAFNNLYIADTGNNRIRKVDTNGVITTVAGNGIVAYSGDGGTATNASFNHPTAVAFDAIGNLYIADEYNALIRKVGTNGVITTVAGENGYTGYNGDGHAATQSGLYYPSGVALDGAGNLYIADEDSNRIRKVGTNGIMTTVAGNGSYGYSGDGGKATTAELAQPGGVAVDASGNLYIADSVNNRIRQVDTNGIITTLAGGGSGGDGGAATNASLSGPYGLGLDASGNLYIADSGNNRICKVYPLGYPTLSLTNVSALNAGSYTVVISNAYGSVTSAVATLTVEAPAAITLEPTNETALGGSSPVFSVGVAGSEPFGYFWYFDSTNLMQSGTNSALTLPGVGATNGGSYTVVVTNAYGSVTSQVATLTVVFAPSVTGLPASQTVLAGTTASLSATVGGTGPFTYQWQFNGTNLPNGILSTVAGKGPNGYGNGSYSGDGGAATNASLNFPVGLRLDALGNVYIADQYNSRVRKVDTSGIITTVAGNGSKVYSGDGGAATNASLYGPVAVAFDVPGNLYIADQGNQRIRMVDTNGIITTVAGGGSGGDGGAATNASLSSPFDVAFDAAGNLYIAAGNLIRKVDTNGIITTVAGNGSYGFSGDGGAATNASLYNPYGVALDAVGNLYIADSGYGHGSGYTRIRKVDTNGIITTVAGNGLAVGIGGSGDGGAATNAGLYEAADAAVDAFGDLYIADQSRIRKVDTNGIITTVPGAASLVMAWHITLDAAGNLFISDDYYNRVFKVLLYAGYPTLTLSDVGTNNAGIYTLVVTNAYGSVTSAVVALNVAMTQPQIVTGDACFGFLTNQFGFNLSADCGQTMVVDGSMDLVNWTPLFTNTAVGGPCYFCDPCWTNFPRRFYRVRLP